jgi:hypothetical protein
MRNTPSAAVQTADGAVNAMVYIMAKRFEKMQA